MSILITVCVRGGSKGIPGKNIKDLNNKPLIYYTLNFAEKFAEIHPGTFIYLSTESKEIKEVVKDLNLSMVNIDHNRPPELATDTSGKLGAIRDLKEFAEKQQKQKFNYIIDLDVTSPLRSIDDLEKSLEMLKAHEEALNIFSVSPANRNPYFNMVEEKGDGYVKLVKEGNFLSRQAAPVVYDMNASFYIFSSNFFKRSFSGAITEKTLAYNVPHLCFDLDEPIDFEFMEFLLSKDKLNFEFIK